jgi:hypothetical protein
MDRAAMNRAVVAQGRATTAAAGATTQEENLMSIGAASPTGALVRGLGPIQGQPVGAPIQSGFVAARAVPARNGEQSAARRSTFVRAATSTTQDVDRTGEQLDVTL